jgi:hypothetical protein
MSTVFATQDEAPVDAVRELQSRMARHSQLGIDSFSTEGLLAPDRIYRAASTEPL